MKLGELYRRIVEVGIQNDPRGPEGIQKELDSTKKQYEKLTGDDKEFFDQEKLSNPYADTRILWGDAEADVHVALVGVDLEAQEVVLADRLRERGTAIDLLLAHHPEGTAMVNLYQVMGMQADVLATAGVPLAVAEGMMEGRIKEVARRLMPANHTRAVDAARLLGLPIMCAHTASDNCVQAFLQKKFDEEKPYKVEDVLDLLHSLPEYSDARRIGAGPTIFLGGKDRRAGKVLVDMTGGTSGSKEVFQKIANTNVGTIVGMHMGDDHRKEAEKHHLNVVIAGHMASDSVGMNILLDGAAGDDLDIVACSGFVRYSRL
jgi:hypothetical protein